MQAMEMRRMGLKLKIQAERACSVHHCAPLFTTPMPKVKQKKSDRPDKPRLSVSLPRDLYVEVEAISKRDSRSMGWVVRKAVENLVKAELPLFNQN